VCTTLINVIVYYISAHLLNISTIVATGIAWVIAVLFAYITNRKWVFQSHGCEGKSIAREILLFFTCRLFTGFLDLALMFVLVDCLRFNDLIIKFTANFMVIIINYIASKVIIFKK